MSRQIRCATTVGPYEINYVLTNQEFHATKPPTNEEAFAKFKGLHDFSQTIFKRQSTLEVALKTGWKL